MRVLSSLLGLCLFLVLWAPLTALAQATGTVTGVVTSETGQPLAGVQVSIPGTPRGALTRTDGRYLITAVPAGQHQIRAALVGYGTVEETVTVAMGETATADFRLMHRAVELEGIVAVGYGVQRRQEVTGAVASVSPARLEDVPNTTVMQALQAGAPGVYINTHAAGAEPQFNMLIRGANSITASNEPLIVLDGIPYSGNLAEINQNDIASIDVLRDASSTAIYGSRGANGVVIITTHQGRVGRPTIRYEGYTGMQELANKPRLMNGQEFAAWKCEFRSETHTCEEALTLTELAHLNAGRETDWIALATRRAIQQQHNLSLSGGSEDTRFYISGAALDNQGTSVGDQFRRYSVRVNLDQRLGTWLDMGLSTQLSQTDRSGRHANYNDVMRANPLISPYDEDGNFLVEPWPEDPERINSLQNTNIIDDDLSRRALASGFAEARLPLVEGLSFRINGGIDFMTRNNSAFWTRTGTRVGFSNQGRSVTQDERAFDWTLENILRFTRQLGVHNLDVTALYSAQKNTFDWNEVFAQGFPNDVLTYRQAHLARLVVPSYEVLESGLLSQMGRVNYGYDGRYLLTLTARRDGYSGFGERHKYGVFPSMALAWNISNEGFWPLEVLNELRLRFSYGQNGNQAIQPYQTLSRLAEFPSYDGQSTWPGFIPSTLGNQNLRWETTTSLNGGLDFGMLANRLRGTVDVYSALTHDLLLERLVSPTHGITRMMENVGKVRNRGVELGLTGLLVERPRFSWSVDFNVSANRNRIVDLYGDATDDVVNQWFIGHPIRTNFGYVFDGIWQTGDDIANSAQPDARPGDVRVRDVNGDGRIDPADRIILGDEDPSYIAGLGSTVRYGGISLTAFLHTIQGVQRYNELLEHESQDRRNNLLFDYWRPDNPINHRWANRPGSNLFHAGYYEDASFIRLRDVTLSYDLPPTVSGRIGAEGLRVFASGRNLWTHTNWTGLDPELSIRQRAVPLERLISIGINASF